MSRILFVNRFYAPDEAATAQLLTDLAEHLAAEGETVRVLTSRLRYQKDARPLPAREQRNGVEIYRLRSSAFGQASLAGRAVDYLTFYIATFFAVLRLADAGDRVVAKTDPPFLGAVILWAVRLRRARLINWMQDVFPEVAAQLGLKVARGPLGWCLIRLRDYSMRHACANVVIGRGMGTLLEARGANRVTCIPNWVDTRLITAAPADNALRREWQLTAPFLVEYSGNLGRAHDAQTLLDAAEHLRHRDDIHFLWIGGGVGFSWLRKEAERLGLGNCSFRDYQPRAVLAQSLGMADVHLVSLRPELEGLLVPSKMYGVMAAGKPILSVGSLHGEVAGEIERGQCGIAIAAGDGAGLAATIQRLACNPEEVRRMGENAREHVVANSDRRVALARWQAVLGG